jgi:hypothetical protein
MPVNSTKPKIAPLMASASGGIAASAPAIGDLRQAGSSFRAACIYNGPRYEVGHVRFSVSFGGLAQKKAEAHGCLTDNAIGGGPIG